MTGWPARFYIRPVWGVARKGAFVGVLRSRPGSRAYRVQIDGETKNLLTRHGATDDRDYEQIDEDKFIMVIDSEVYKFVEDRRTISQDWNQSLKEVLRYGQLLVF